MSWNYRIVRQKDKTCRNGYWYEVCEVFYNDKGEPEKFGRAGIAGETIKECFMETIPLMLEGMRKAYLRYPEDFKTGGGYGDAQKPRTQHSGKKPNIKRK